MKTIAPAWHGLEAGDWHDVMSTWPVRFFEGQWRELPANHPDVFLMWIMGVPIHQVDSADCGGEVTI